MNFEAEWQTLSKLCRNEANNSTSNPLLNNPNDSNNFFSVPMVEKISLTFSERKICSPFSTNETA